MGNIIYDEATNDVTFIDFEYAACNYQAFDIGNHFNEFAGTLDDFQFYIFSFSCFISILTIIHAT